MIFKVRPHRAPCIGAESRSTGKRPQACIGCHSGCRGRYEDGLGNEATCFATIFYLFADTLDVQRKACDLLNRYGLNAAEMLWGELYLRDLHRADILGPGKEIDCPLKFENYGKLEFAEQLVKMIAYRNDGLGNRHIHSVTIWPRALFESSPKVGHGWTANTGDLKTGRLQIPVLGTSATQRTDGRNSIGPMAPF